MKIFSKILVLSSVFFISLCFADGTLQTIGDLSVNLTNQMPPYSTMISGFAFIMGIVFVISGVLKVKHQRESPQGNSPMGGPIYIVMGVFLIYLPTTISFFSSSVFGDADLETGMRLYYNATLMDGTATGNTSV
jgi:Na+-driven multidrug efflux pump